MGIPTTIRRSLKDKDAIINSGVIDMLTEGGMDVLTVDDKLCKGKFILCAGDTNTEFTYEEAFETTGEMKPAFIDKIRDWLFAQH